MRICGDAALPLPALSVTLVKLPPCFGIASQRGVEEGNESSLAGVIAVRVPAGPGGCDR